MRERQTGSAAWLAFTLLGIAGWIGVTVFVAATNPDPSDGTPIMRTFAVAGAIFFGAVFAAAAVQMRTRRVRVNERLYRLLAVSQVPPGLVRAAARRGVQHGYVYLLFAGVGTALLLTTIGLGEQGPYELLLGAGIVLVLVWLGYMVVALRSSFRGSNDLLNPLGLSVVETPTYVPAGGGRLVGRLSLQGVRHGRRVTVSQTTSRSVTELAGEFPRRSLTSAATMASMTGQPAAAWRGVTAESGPGGVTVRRHRNGAGRWYLYDLLLAEQLAGGAGQPGAAIGEPV